MSNKAYEMFRNTELWETLTQLALWVCANLSDIQHKQGLIEHEEGMISWIYRDGQGDLTLGDRHVRVIATYEVDKYGRVTFDATAIVAYEDYDARDIEDWDIARIGDSEAEADFSGTADSMAGAIAYMWWMGKLVQNDVLGFVR